MWSPNVRILAMPLPGTCDGRAQRLASEGIARKFAKLIKLTKEQLTT